MLRRKGQGSCLAFAVTWLGVGWSQSVKHEGVTPHQAGLVYHQQAIKRQPSLLQVWAGHLRAFAKDLNGAVWRGRSPAIRKKWFFFDGTSSPRRHHAREHKLPYTHTPHLRRLKAKRRKRGNVRDHCVLALMQQRCTHGYSCMT